MGLGRVDCFARIPAMRNAWPDQHEVAVIIGTDIIANITMAPTVERQRQFVLRMVVPLERYAVGQPPVEKSPGRPGLWSNRFKERLHRAPSHWITQERQNSTSFRERGHARET